jgi:hypothetical protein
VEPFATLKTPLRYEHALSATGASTALTIARMTLPPREGWAVGDACWIAIVQDERFAGPRAAAMSDTSGLFADAAVAMPRQRVGDPAFESAFAVFAATSDDAARALSPSARKLVLGWRIPLHFEVRAGGYVLAPVALPADPASLGWLIDACGAFAEKARKTATG